MATWPDLAALTTWMSADALGAAGEDENALQLALDSATEMISAKLDAELMPTDPTECPASVALAIMMRALSLFMRRASPTGVIATDPNNVFRVNRMDADVDQQIAAYVAFPVA